MTGVPLSLKREMLPLLEATANFSLLTFWVESNVKDS